MTGGDPGEHRTRQRPLPEHPLAGSDHRERPRGRNAKAVHGLADQVLAQHRAQHGLTVAAPGEPRAPGPLEMKVAAATPGIDHLTEQHRAAVPEAGGVHAELMTGVGLRDRPDPLRGPPGQQRDAWRLPQHRRVDAQLGRQLLVEDKQLGGGRLGRCPRHGKAGHRASIGVFEPEHIRRDGRAFEVTDLPPSGKPCPGSAGHEPLTHTPPSTIA